MTTSSVTGWFTTEIQLMMHGFGDSRKPLLESAVLIESLVHRQMLIVLEKLSDAAALRGSRHIGIEEILYVLRHDKVKLRRLLRYIELTDMKSSAGRSFEEDDGLTDSKSAPRRRTKICYDFLNSIDTTGELVALFDDTGHDDVKMERLLRAELHSRTMDPQQYKDFCEARQANFGRKLKLQKFKEWLMGTNDCRLNVLALEVMSYLAFETVAQIVDLSLLVKKDMSADVSDPVSRFVPSAMNHDMPFTDQAGLSRPQSPNSPTTRPNQSSDMLGTSLSSQSSVGSGGLGSSGGSSLSKSVKSSSRKKSSSSRPTSDLLSANAITPAHIKEVVRRYNTEISPFLLFAKQPVGGARHRLFCC